MQITSAESGIAIAALGLVAVWIQNRRSKDGRRSQIKQDLELLNLLPQESGARSDLMTHIDMEIVHLIKGEGELTRDGSGISLAIVILAIAISLVILAIINSGWSWLLLIPSILLGTLGAVGLGESAPKKKRDSKGGRIKG